MINDSWWIDLTFNRTRYRKRSPQNSKAGAQAYEVTLRQKLARGEEIDKEEDRKEREITFEQFAWKWFDEYVVTNNKYSEQRAKRSALRSWLIPFFGTFQLAKIRSRHVEQFKARALRAGLSRKTINNHLTIFRKCACTAYEWLGLPGAPPTITWLKCPPTVADYLSPDECSLLLSRAKGVTYEMILTALRTGMRQGELKGLQWSSIDWQSRSITVQHSRCDYTGELTSPKNNRIRHIPMDVDVYEMLLRQKRTTGYVFLNANNRPFDGRRLKFRLAVVRRRAGLRKIGWHTLRHTFASHLAMRGVPMTAVQTLMGHSSITTTMRYAHLTPSTLQAAIAMLNPKTMLNADFGQPAGNAWLETQRSEMARNLPPQNTEELQAKIAA
ncbi:MAG: tyrosine-type recombinase/integrase [Candidatus Sulfotelmatobacter sp.]|jgi:integrase